MGFDSLSPKFHELNSKREQLFEGGGSERIAQQHDKGKMTARERLDYFFDEGTFIELNVYSQHNSTEFGLAKTKAYGDGVITGFGLVNGRKVFAYAQDFTFLGGSLGEMHAAKIAALQDKAIAAKCPIVGLHDSGGARIQEGIRSLAGFGKIFYRNVKASGVIPQIAVIMGPCAGGAVYSPGLMDFVFMVENTGQMFITGPKVIATVTGEKVSIEELGGARTHTEISGVAHKKAKDDKTCLDYVKELMSYLPDSAIDSPKQIHLSESTNIYCEELDDIIPENPAKSYDISQIIGAVLDDGAFYEIHDSYALNIRIGFGKIDGTTVGIVANNSQVLAGCLDIKGSKKAARFIRTCDSFGIPLVTFVDTPGFLPGTDQEYGGIIRDGATILYAYSEATVPKITVVLRKAYGGAYIAMCSRELGADAVFAWPGAEIAVMGPEGAVDIVYKREIDNSKDPDIARREKIEEYKQNFANPFNAANSGFIDDVILPGETRQRIIMAIMMASNDKADNKIKHGNIPI